MDQFAVKQMSLGILAGTGSGGLFTLGSFAPIMWLLHWWGCECEGSLLCPTAPIIPPQEASRLHQLAIFQHPCIISKNFLRVWRQNTMWPIVQQSQLSSHKGSQGWFDSGAVRGALLLVANWIPRSALF